jgi:DNA-binding transcriptional LysR family regulator
VREVRDLAGGTVAFGTFGSAHHYLLGGLVQDFRQRFPNVRVRVVGQNSAEVADEVREGTLEAGLVVLPIDDRGLDVRPAMREEELYISADEERLREPVTIERLATAPLILYDARWGADDPTRRQLRERAQEAGVKVEPVIEVEYLTAALDLAARGLGDTVSPLSIITSRGYSRRLGGVPFDPPLYSTFAFITRRDAHLSPATRAFMELAERRVAALERRLAEAG